MKRTIGAAVAMSLLLASCGRTGPGKAAAARDGVAGGSDSASSSNGDNPPFTVDFKVVADGSGSIHNVMNLTATVDNLTINAVQQNRGNCQVYGYPMTLKFGDKVNVFSTCDGNDVLEMQVDTTVGSWTWSKQ